jgi:dTDP-glucose 4,6-dehydratase
MQNPKTKTILVTGGCGFIGSNFIRHTLQLKPQWRIINLDALTYAGNGASLEDVAEAYPARYQFWHGDIGDSPLLEEILEKDKPDGIFHFAAESHVDRSIHGPLDFVQTNVVGTCRLLAACQQAWSRWGRPDSFRFLHVSTDEVYGSLADHGYFTESTPYDPSSPYSASKAASDHFVKAWHRTYGLPAVITNCSNNYGPFQFPEKLIPLMILHILERKELPVYGDGKNIRDWLYVIDHCEALLAVFENGRPGETYNIGGGVECRNLDLVEQLCALMDRRLNRTVENDSRQLIRFVTDRPGHDRRYAIDADKIRRELGWRPRFEFDAALAETVDWYLANADWIDSVRSGAYRNWIVTHYGDRSNG